MTAARSAGIPVAVNAAGLTTSTVVVVGATDFLAALGGEEHPRNAKAATRRVNNPTKIAGRDRDSDARGMAQPYVVPTARPHVLPSVHPRRRPRERVAPRGPIVPAVTSRWSDRESLLVGSNRSRNRVLDVAVLDVAVLNVAVLNVAQWRSIQLRVRGALERERLVLLGTVSTDHDDLAGLDLAVENLLGKDVLDVALNRATQGTCAEHTVVAPLREQRLGRGRELDAHVLVLHPNVELGDHQVDDLDDLGLRQLWEDDDVVHPVEKLRPEVLLELVGDLVLHPLVAGPGVATGREPERLTLGDVPGAKVRGHD